ncbi:MAG: NUDIX domain-containing protein [Dehalococcoidia bacterium]
MKSVHVVTSFLLRRDGEKERVLLLRRSDRVGSFPGRWAGVSGYLEMAAPHQALTEIREETGLGESDVVLVSRGRPVRAPDPVNDCVWVVHPFLFLVVRPHQVRLDWEHTECRWVRPSSLERFDTVPTLRQALDRVYPPAVWSGIPRGLLAIARDRTSGASGMALAAAGFINDGVQASRVDSPAGLLRGLRDVCRSFASVRPSMTPLANMAAQLMDEAARSPQPGAVELKRLVHRLHARMNTGPSKAQGRVARHARPIMTGTVITISYSETVLLALQTTQEGLEKTIVAEGRPGLEGRKMAQRLARSAPPINASVVSDALAPSMVRDADAVVVGADTITAAGEVVNKAGTYALALAARDQRKPFYVLAESWKVSPGSRPPALEVMPPEELWPDAPRGVGLHNQYFDVTPARLVTAYVTEDGLVDRRWIAEKARTFRRARRRLGV